MREIEKGREEGRDPASPSSLGGRRCIIQLDILRSHTYGTRVKPPASDDGLLRYGGKVGRKDRVEDAFFFGVLVRWSDIISVESRNWCLMDAAIKNRVWKEIWKRYDFLDHERARDVRLRKIKKLYQSYKVKLHKRWLEHQ
ncbi:hypothetical protein COCNU_10G005120 [Cocos nucifera]|uniref:Uncharacterized protein n=1 Tax=Cocos nucifera TaxID=13894 RepID=A0A8K0ILX0_COCNU|nr:hypothetical protein COCNU_10G005120 [Cocos nucifera]